MNHLSDEVRRQSQSEGAFSGLTDHVLKRGGAIYGASFGEGLCVVHRRAEDDEGRDALRGSKYVQNDLGYAFLKAGSDLTGGRHVTFTGTPCQMAGLKDYQGAIGADASRLPTVDIICYGVLPYRIFRNFIGLLEEADGSKVTDFKFRSEVKG